MCLYIEHIHVCMHTKREGGGGGGGRGKEGGGGVVLFPADFSPSVGKSTSGNPPIPFRSTVFQSLLASRCTLHVDSNAILRDVTR